MAYRNKTYIAFDGDKDMGSYRLMTAWAANDRFGLDIYNAHDLNTARDTSQPESIKRQLRVRFSNSKLFIVLIGESTRFLTKFVKWEIETAIGLGLPIIGINLNNSRAIDSLCPPSLRDALAVYIPFREKVITYAINDWPISHKLHDEQGKTGPFYYKESVYQKLGL